jgi:integrase
MSSSAGRCRTPLLPGTNRERRANPDGAAFITRGGGRTALLLFSGLRISEALGLTWRDVDLSTGHLRVRHQLSRSGERVRLKTAGARRDVVIIDSLARILHHHRFASPHNRPGDPVFATASATPLSARNAARAFAGLVNDAALTDVTPHALRHTYASMLIAQGRDAVYVADQLGHSTPVITLRTYAHLFCAAQQEPQARNELEPHTALSCASGEPAREPQQRDMGKSDHPTPTEHRSLARTR